MRAFALLIVCFAICRPGAQGQGSAPPGPTNPRLPENAKKHQPEAPIGSSGSGVMIDVSTNLGRGIAAELTQNNMEAVRFLTKAIEQEHDNAKNLALAYRFRGLAYKHLGRREDALRDFLEVIRIDPQLDLGYYDAGVIYNRTNRYQEAVEAMTRAIAVRQRNSSLALPLSERGNAYFHLGQFEKAQTDLAAAVQRRGFDRAQRKGSICDGQKYNWSLYELHLVALGFVGILDFLHLLAYLYGAAQAVEGKGSVSAWTLYESWLRLAWAGRVLHGDLGYSFTYQTPAWDVIAERIPLTFQLQLAAIVVALAVSIPAGCSRRCAIARYWTTRSRWARCSACPCRTSGSG